MNKTRQKIFGSIFLVIGLILVFGMSIWLGFPSPYFNRIAITPVTYGVGAIFFATGAVLLAGHFD